MNGPAISAIDGWASPTISSVLGRPIDRPIDQWAVLTYGADLFKTREQSPAQCGLLPHLFPGSIPNQRCQCGAILPAGNPFPKAQTWVLDDALGPSKFKREGLESQSTELKSTKCDQSISSR